MSRRPPRATHTDTLVPYTPHFRCASGAALAEVESKDPIKLTLHDWTGQLITTKLMGSVLQKAGYNVEYVQADYIAQFAGLKTGDLHVAMEMWETTGREAMDEATATGNVENIGETGMQAIEEDRKSTRLNSSH